MHHLGSPTATEAKEVEDKVKSIGAKVVVVEGDISQQETSQKVRLTLTYHLPRPYHPYTIPSLMTSHKRGFAHHLQIVSVAVETFGRIDALVSNAGICQFHKFLDLPADLYRLHRSINMDGAFFISQAVAGQMVKQEPVDGERGSIVGISSISAIMGGGEQCHYTPTKAGIKSLMESEAIALGPYGIRCNSIMPGMLRFGLGEEGGLMGRNDCDADE